MQQTSPAVSGAELFARYAYPPNELGYCGPGDPRGLLVRGTPEAERVVRARARQFEGAWVYLELIAELSSIEDPLDPRVVAAYWLGDDLLDAIDSAEFLARLRVRLAGQTGGQWTGGIAALDSSVLPQHAFHVFAVYPWVGLLGRDSDVPLAILDKCRIRTGLVTAVDGPRVLVSVRPLSWDGERLGHGPAADVVARWSDDGRSFLDGVSPGDLVSVHWDWVCDIVSPSQAAAVENYERRQLGATNEVLATARRT